MNLTYFHPERRGNVENKTTAQSISDLSLKHQTSDISVKTSAGRFRLQRISARSSTGVSKPVHDLVPLGHPVLSTCTTSSKTKISLSLVAVFYCYFDGYHSSE